MKLRVVEVGMALSCAAALFAGCSSTPVNAPGPGAPPVVATPSVNPASNAARPVANGSAASDALPAYLDPRNPISTQRSVYFDFDEFVVKGQYLPLIERHGKYLAANSKVNIKIEGNADERGSAEYDLALGQRRAEAVLRALRLQGVKDSQMEAISWGRERPRATGHDEAAWAENRRADLVYPSK